VIKNILLILIACVSLASCSSDNKNAESPPKNFFDLKGYVADYVIQMEAINPKVKKIVNKDNSESQTITLDSVNWAKELALLTESDINKSAYKDKFKVDSLTDCLRYTALDSSLNTRLLKVCFVDDSVKQIYVERGEKNILYKSGQVLNFYPSGKYSVEAKQKIKGLGNNLFKTSIEIIK
jgi:hypothetical protein